MNYLARVIAFSLMAFLAHHLRESVLRIKTLEGFLPICCVCHKIRGSDNTWKPLEAYLSSHTDTKFSHSYCPTCLTNFYHQIEQIKSTPSDPANSSQP